MSRMGVSGLVRLMGDATSIVESIMAPVEARSQVTKAKMVITLELHIQPFAVEEASPPVTSPEGILAEIEADVQSALTNELSLYSELASYSINVADAIVSKARRRAKVDKAAMVQQLGIPALLDGQPWSNSDPRAIAIQQAALKSAKEVKRWLGLTIKAEQTPSEVVNKLLKKLGLQTVCVSRLGKRGEQRERAYEIKDFENLVGADPLH